MNERDGRRSSKPEHIRSGGTRSSRQPTVRRSLVVAVGVMLFTVAPARAGTVLRGICEPNLIWDWQVNGPALVEDFADDLGADVVRVNLRWSEAEPSPGVYDEDYMARAVSAVGGNPSRGMQVLIDVWKAPRWASNRALLRATAMPGDQAGVYHGYYSPFSRQPRRAAGLHGAALRQTPGRGPGVRMLERAQLLDVLLSPAHGVRPAFSADRYTMMLKAFAQGVRAGDPQAEVVAGETAPFGDNTKSRTSPQRFARQIAGAGAAAYFDAYSHHPYAIAGNESIAPAALPRDPRHTVCLGNVGVLLDVFPGKPLYLTEFGYETARNWDFGVWVSPARQASYLKAAFRVAARTEGVGMLAWYPLEDSSADGTYDDRRGNYCGLVNLRGQRKPAYFAFAGGNELTLAEPGRVTPGGSLVLSGVLTSARMGPLAGKTLAVLAHLPDRPWVVVAKATTGSDGSYTVRLRPYASATWKVRWSGVVTSPRRWVPVG